MSEKITAGVIGLGSMGYGIAGAILNAGHKVFGFDRAAEPVSRFVESGGLTGELPKEAGAFDIAVIVVLNAGQTESVLFGENGIVSTMKKGAAVISCATVSPAFAKKMADKCAKKGVHYLDAPISGGSVKASQGKLSVMASGSPDAFTSAEPALDAMAEKVFRLGNTAGTGSAMKAVNQLLAGVHIASMAEAVTFGIHQGISAQKIVEVITQSAGNSWMFENRAPHVVKGDYTPHSAVDIWPKDLGVVTDIARESGFSAPLAATALQQFVAASGSGLGREDDAAVAKVYARNANIKLPGVETP